MKGDPIRLGCVVTSNIISDAALLKPFVGLPEGARVRLRVRSGEFPTVFVKTARGISWHYIEDHGENLRPSSITLARNQTIRE